MFTKNTYMYEMSKLWSVYILIIVVLLGEKNKPVWNYNTKPQSQLLLLNSEGATSCFHVFVDKGKTWLSGRPWVDDRGVTEASG